jgi:hypothetical protein
LHSLFDALFNRQSPVYSEAGQQKLKDSTVLIIGCGALSALYRPFYLDQELAVSFSSTTTLSPSTTSTDNFSTFLATLTNPRPNVRPFVRNYVFLAIPQLRHELMKTELLN